MFTPPYSPLPSESSAVSETSETGKPVLTYVVALDADGCLIHDDYFSDAKKPLQPTLEEYEVGLAKVLADQKVLINHLKTQVEILSEDYRVKVVFINFSNRQSYQCDYINRTALCKGIGTPCSSNFKMSLLSNLEMSLFLIKLIPLKIIIKESQNGVFVNHEPKGTRQIRDC